MSIIFDDFFVDIRTLENVIKMSTKGRAIKRQTR